MENIKFSLEGFEQDNLANEYEDQSLRTIIGKTDTLDELEAEWNDFMVMPKSHRIDSDRRSIELYGITNKEHYEQLRSKFLNQEPEEQTEYEPDAVKEEVEAIIKQPVLDNENIQKSIDWSNDSMKIIINPNVNTLEDLESNWNEFMSMTMDSRNISDTKCIDFFGVKNQELYDYLKGKLLKKYTSIEDKNKEPITPTETPLEEAYFNILRNKDIEESYEFINEYNPKNIYESTLIDSLNINTNIPCSGNTLWTEMPFFSPDEMINYGVFSGEANRFSKFPDNNTIGSISVEEWFKEYYIRSKGISTLEENTQPEWITTLNKLYLDYDNILESGDINTINSRKQSILELGWNPNIKFNAENRCKCSKNTTKSIIESYNNYSIIDVKNTISESVLNESNSNQSMNPVSLILIRGDTILAKVITKVTKSNFSHIAISLDSDLKKLYSFNARGEFDGLSYESIDKYKKDGVMDITLFTFFLKKSQYNMLEKNIDYYVLNKNKTKYSFMNLAAIPLNVSLNFDMKMVCSEFIDRILKLTNIDLTEKDSTLVTPNDIYKSIKNNSKIYLIYSGDMANFNIKKATTKIKNLSNNGELFQESKSYTKASILEVKEFPVQFDDDGNLLIKKMTSIDFEQEYSTAHRLLIAYHKNNNVEGMKYEVAKLQFLNKILENHIYYDKKDNKKEYYIKVRARILNDFNKYLNILLKLEPAFIFGEYFDSTPFSDAIIKIRSSTLKHGIHILRGLF